MGNPNARRIVLTIPAHKAFLRHGAGDSVHHIPGQADFTCRMLGMLNTLKAQS